MMKKIAFAAIGAGLAGSALAADTSVTLYGLLDMGLGYERAPGFKQNRIGTVQGVNSGSRFGARTWAMACARSSPWKAASRP